MLDSNQRNYQIYICMFKWYLLNCKMHTAFFILIPCNEKNLIIYKIASNSLSGSHWFLDGWSAAKLVNFCTLTHLINLISNHCCLLQTHHQTDKTREMTNRKTYMTIPIQ